MQQVDPVWPTALGKWIHLVSNFRCIFQRDLVLEILIGSKSFSMKKCAEKEIGLSVIFEIKVTERA